MKFNIKFYGVTRDGYGVTLIAADVPFRKWLFAVLRISPWSRRARRWFRDSAAKYDRDQLPPEGVFWTKEHGFKKEGGAS